MSSIRQADREPNLRSVRDTDSDETHVQRRVPRRALRRARDPSSCDGCAHRSGVRGTSLEPGTVRTARRGCGCETVSAVAAAYGIVLPAGAPMIRGLRSWSARRRWCPPLALVGGRSEPPEVPPFDRPDGAGLTFEQPRQPSAQLKRRHEGPLRIVNMVRDV